MVSNGENSQLNLHLHGNKYGKIIQVFMADSIMEMEDHPTDQCIEITIQATVGKIKKKNTHSTVQRIGTETCLKH